MAASGSGSGVEGVPEPLYVSSKYLIISSDSNKATLVLGSCTDSTSVLICSLQRKGCTRAWRMQ